MMKPGPSRAQVHPGPQPRDFLTDVDGEGRSRSPEPRVAGKNVLNPPIVTIFGGGVAGLTAAHELVERGFLVQVVEAHEDLSTPGRPLVGGMAASQKARVRANVEDLHRRLMAEALASGPQDPARKVANGLMELFAIARSRWIQTETPERINGAIYSRPAEKHAEVAGPRHPKTKVEKFEKQLLASLESARKRYRERWVWDLVVRGALTDVLELSGQDDRKKRWEVAHQKYGQLVQAKDNLELAKGALALLGREMPPLDPLKRMVDAALDREFLCFRLVPFARRGFEGGMAVAKQLFEEWREVFAKQGFGASCISCAGEAARAAPHGMLFGSDGEPVEIKEAEAPEEFTGLAWLQIEVVEQLLPGEHGYRFFPSFYGNLDNTMKRIPLFDVNAQRTGRSVLDNLLPTVDQGIGLSARDRKENDIPSLSYDDPDPCPIPGQRKSDVELVPFQRDLPKSLEGLRDRTDRFVAKLGGNERDSLLLLGKLTRFITSSPERRRKEYEKISWSEFVHIKSFSPQMRTQIEAAAQALLAFSAKEADARTYGDVAIRLLMDELGNGTQVDRTLNGPTSDAWLEPWRDYLEKQGVRFFHKKLEKLEWRDVGGHKELVPILSGSAKSDVGSSSQGLLTWEADDASLRPDFYVLAVNIEQAHKMIAGADLGANAEKDAPDFKAMAPFYAEVKEKKALKEMTGIQYFFDARTDIGKGHLYFPFAPWGLSSISQSEFWSARGGFADGYFGVLSVDVCTVGDYGTPGDFRNVLKEGKELRGVKGLDEGSRRFEAARETLQQIKDRIPQKLAEPRCFHMDDNIFLDEQEKPHFLANMYDVKARRPGQRGGSTCVGPNEIRYALNHQRWVMAGSYMATHTRLTTMEAANESAKHAVVAILEELGKKDTAKAARPASGELHVENLANERFNWAMEGRNFDLPDIYNMEDRELEDLEIFRRVDRRLVALDLPHFFDILDFDRKLEHAIEGFDLYGQEKPLSDLLQLSVASLDAVLTDGLGTNYPRYADRAEGDFRKAVTQLDKLSHRADGTQFTDMKLLFRRLEELTKMFDEANKKRPR